MKRVSFKNLNLSLTEVLSRQDMKKIRGGYGYGDDNICKITVTNADGSPGGVYTDTYPPGTPCDSQSSSTNQQASNWVLQHPGGSAKFDCGCDGWGV